MDVELLGEYFYKSKNCNENQPNSGLLPAVPAHLQMADLGLSNRGLSSPRTPCSGRACAHAGGRAEPPRPVPAARVLLPTVPVAVDSHPPAASSPEEWMPSSVVHLHVWTDTCLWEELSYGVCVRGWRYRRIERLGLDWECEEQKEQGRLQEPLLCS